MSAGHDTTGRPDPDRGRDAAVAKMLTGEASAASPKPLSADVLAIVAAAEEQRDATLSFALDEADLTCSVSSEVRATIKAHRDIMIDTRIRGDETDEEFDRDAEAQIDAEYAVAHVPVRSLADVRAKLTYLVPILAPDMLCRTHVAHLEAIRDDVDRLCRQPAATAGRGAASTSDPIFAAIEEAWSLTREHGRLLDLCAAHPDTHPSRQPESEAHAAMWEHVRSVVLKTVPATAQGCTALARFAVAFTKDQGVPLGDGDDGNDPVLDLIARSPTLPSPAPSSDLAEACVEQVKRLRHWDANPGSLSEAEGDAEMDRWGALFRRAIEEPSAGPRDLAGKACLSLHDMDQFYPEERYKTDDWRLLRVILREAIDMGALAGPGSCSTVEEGATHSDAVLLSAITEHRLAERAFHASVNPADDAWVRQNGGDTSEPAMAAPRKASAEAEARASQAWRDLFKVRPQSLNGLCRLLEHVSEHFDAHSMMADDPPDVFGMLSASADGLRHTSFEVSPPHDLSKLSILQLELLADLCRRQAQTLSMATLYPACQPPEGRRYNDNPLHDILDVEETRIAILGDMAGREIERRRPECVWDRNLRLEALIRADLAGNGYIEPALLAEAVAAWGTP